MAQTTQSDAISSASVNRTKIGNKRPEGYSRHWEQNGEALPDTEDARNTRKQKYEELVNE
jgi:sterol 24-C-methyltransferase